MNRNLRCRVLPIVALALLTGCGGSLQAVPTIAPAPTTAPTTAADQLDALFTQWATLDFFSGTVLVARGDEILLRKGYGLSDRDAKIANTPSTVYRIGYTTNPLTAVGILLLESQGKLSVNDPICTYLDECPAAWEPVTLHHLLSNTSGIPGYWLKDRTTPVAPLDLIATVRDRPLIFEPGSRWDAGMSQTNYALLGMVIERVAGQPYATFMHEQVFEPLGMAQTGLTGQPTDLAIGYLSRQAAAEPIADSVAYAAYGLYSTVDDLYRFEQALHTGELLPAAQREAMLTSYINTFDSPMWGYGYGTLLSDTYLPGHKLVSLSVPWSGYPGFWSAAWSLTDLDVNVVILANRQYGPQEDPFSDSVAAIILGSLNP